MIYIPPNSTIKALLTYLVECLYAKLPPEDQQEICEMARSMAERRRREREQKE